MAYNLRLCDREQGYLMLPSLREWLAEGDLELKPMLQTLERTLEAAGIEERPRTVLADAGYWSEANVTACCHPEGTQWLIATTKGWKQRKALRERGCPRGAASRKG